MNVLEKQDLKYLQFSSFAMPGLTQAVFSRHGGISESPWSSLNLGGTVGDDPKNVNTNLDRLLGAVGFGSEQLVQVRQIHSADVIVADHPVDALQQGDAIITNTRGLLLLMRFADCVPILLADPVKQVIGIAHAGWQGTVKEVAFHAARAMEKKFQSNPSDIFAGIGPSIGPDHYVVGEDVIERVKSVFHAHVEDILIKDADGVKLDLWKANAISLRRAGVKNIEQSGICTACNTADWYSHRAEAGKTGRFAAVIGMK
jgi:YfiH family protein